MAFIKYKSQFEYAASYPREFHAAMADISDECKRLRLSPRKHIQCESDQHKPYFDRDRQSWQSDGYDWAIEISDELSRRMEQTNDPVWTFGLDG